MPFPFAANVAFEKGLRLAVPTDVRMPFGCHVDKLLDRSLDIRLPFSFERLIEICHDLLCHKAHEKATGTLFVQCRLKSSPVSRTGSRTGPVAFDCELSYTSYMITTAANEMRIWEAMTRLRRPKVICAWCPDFKPSGKAESHGICASCAAKLDAEIAKLDGGLPVESK